MVGSMGMAGGPEREEEEDRAERIASYLAALLVADGTAEDAEYRFNDGENIFVVSFSRKPMSSFQNFGEPMGESLDITHLKRWVTGEWVPPDDGYGRIMHGMKELWTSHLPPGKPCACCQGSGTERSEDDNTNGTFRRR